MPILFLLILLLYRHVQLVVVLIYIFSRSQGLYRMPHIECHIRNLKNPPPQQTKLSRYRDHQSIGPMDDWALGRLGPPPIDWAQPVGRLGPPDLFWLCYLFIFPAISIIIYEEYRWGEGYIYVGLYTHHMCFIYASYIVCSL